MRPRKLPPSLLSALFAFSLGGLGLLPAACGEADPDEAASVQPSGSSAPTPTSTPTATPTGSATTAPTATTPKPDPPPPVQWTPCPLRSEGGEVMAECATIQVPLSHDDPGGEKIETFVKRFRPPGGKSKRALWMLQGGPGGSGYVYEGLSEAFATRYPDVDYYMPDHRGTGKSTKVTCSAQGDDTPSGFLIEEPEWPGCIEEVKAQWGDRLGRFNITGAARDLGLWIERTRQPGQPVFVLGVSYGTTWAQRYLQLFPAQVDGVVLDSIAPPGMMLSDQDKDQNQVAQVFMEFCGANGFCSSKLGTGAEPWNRATGLIQKLKDGHCPGVLAPDGMTRHQALRVAFGSMMMDQRFRTLMPAVIYRFDRCNEEDAMAMNMLFAAFFSPQDLSSNEMLKGWGWVLSENIMYSEMWETPAPSAAALEAIRESAVASRDITEGRAERQAIWPLYEPDEHANQWPQTSLPMLMLQGGLDPATPYQKAKAVKERYAGPHQHFVYFPEATHTTLGSTPTTAKRSCGTMTMMHFIEDPTGPLDTSCLADIVPLSFEKNSFTAALFGTINAWELTHAGSSIVQAVTPVRGPALQ